MRILTLLVCFVLLASVANGQQYAWRYQSSANCSALTAGKFADLCFQTSNRKLYKCVPSGGADTTCDASIEWQEVLSGSADTLADVTSRGASTEVASIFSSGITTDSVQFDTNNTPLPSAEGLMQWNATGNYLDFEGDIDLGEHGISAKTGKFLATGLVSVDAPTNGIATQNSSGTGFYAYNNSMSFKVYAFKSGVFSQALEISFSDNGDESPYSVALSWDAVAGATMYRVTVNDNITYSNEAYVDTATNSLNYNGTVDYIDPNYSEIVPAPQSPALASVGGIEANDGDFHGDVAIDRTLGVDGVSSLNNRLAVTYENNSFRDSVNVAGISLSNPSAGGQNLVSSYINGVLVAKWRTDYVGNISWVATGTGRHDFYVGGDYGTGHSPISIHGGGISMSSGTNGVSNTRSGVSIVNQSNVLSWEVDALGDMYARNTAIYLGTVLGGEKLSNGTFTGNADGWTLPTGFAYNTNLVRKQTDGTGALTQPASSMISPVVVGEEYSLTFTISTRTAGDVIPSCGGVTLTTRRANGTYTETFRAVSTADLAFTPTNTARWYIDGISLKRVSDGDLFVGGNINADTIEAKRKWRKFTANSVTLSVGTSASTVSDLQTMADGTTYTITEASATPAISLIVDFVNIDKFDSVRVLGGYTGSSVHAVAIQLYNWSTSVWDTFNAMQTSYVDATTASGRIFVAYEFNVYDHTNYVGTGGNVGKTRVRFYHTMTGNVSHRLYIDEVSLRK